MIIDYFPQTGRVLDMFPLTQKYLDLFPQTRTVETRGKNINLIVPTHVETVVLLRREKPDAYIDIDVNIEDLYKFNAGQASYEEIRQYIKKEFNLIVSHLNIAQIKRKYGIIERENYNLGQDGHKVPKCTAEKEQAIVEAFRHFRLI